MFTRFNNDQWSALFLFVCGLVSCAGSMKYGLGDLRNPGTGFMPFLAGMAISALSAIGFVKSTLQGRKGVLWRSPLKGVMWGRTLLALGTLVAYAFLLNPLGFTACTALCVGFLFRIGNFYRWSVAIPGGIAAALASYALFVALLRVQLPKGPWGF